MFTGLVAELGTVQKNTSDTAASCIAQAEAAGVDIPKSLKPQATETPPSAS